MKLLNKLFSIKRDNHTKYITIFGLKLKITDKIKRIEAQNRKIMYLIHKYCPAEKRADALTDWYFETTGERLDLNNPKTFNEKIQWLKLYDSTPLKTKLADKYLVRDWVKEKIGEEYLIPLLGVWDRAEDIDFDKLPNQFVLKCNHGCAYNIIVKDKSKLNINKTKEQLNKWMMEDYSFKNGFEMQYSDITPKIIAEEYMETKNGLTDYKVWCFNGEVYYIQYISEREKYYKMAFFDKNWDRQDFISNHKALNYDIAKPKNLDKLIELSEILSNEFKYVRVDFYILDDGSIKFGEMTFTPASGILNWQPKSKNLELGDLINLK